MQRNPLQTRYTKAQSWHAKSQSVTSLAQRTFWSINSANSSWWTNVRIDPRLNFSVRIFSDHFPSFPDVNRRTVHACNLAYSTRPVATRDRRRRQSFRTSSIYVEWSWTALQQFRFRFGILVYSEYFLPYMSAN
jgi:hypothetical protein